MHFSFPLQFFLFLIWHFKNVFWQKWNPSKGEIRQIDGSYSFLQCSITLFEKYYRENIDEEKIEQTKFSRWFHSWIMFVDNCTLTQPSWSTYMSRGMQLYTLLHPPNCNHSHLAKKIFAYLNVSFQLCLGN